MSASPPRRPQARERHPARATARGREEIQVFWRPRLQPVKLGGDHAATLPVTETRGLAIRELGILKLDAHPGLRKEYLGEGNNLAPAMSRAMCVVAPEPYGVTASELIVIFRLFETCQIAGIGLMEVAHTFDLSGRAGITAPRILHEGILM